MVASANSFSSSVHDFLDAFDLNHFSFWGDILTWGLYSYETSGGWYTYFKTSLQPLTILRHLRSLEPKYKYKYGGVMFSLLFSTNVISSTDVISSTGPQRVYSHSFLENGIHTGGPVASVASSYSSWGSTSITGLDTSELSASSSCSDLSEISSSSEVGNIFFTSS